MNPLRSLLSPLLLRLRRLHRRVLLHRRPLAALLTGGAVLAGLQAASPPPPETTAVWTARHDLAGGTMLQPGDLVATRFPPSAVPRGSVRDPQDVVGQTLAAPMARGEVLTGLRTLSRGLLEGYPGRTAVPLRVTDGAVVELLRVGDRVSVVATDPDGRAAPELLLEDTLVVALPREQETLSGTGQPGRLVVVAVTSERASEVAARAATSILIPVWNQ